MVKPGMTAAPATKKPRHANNINIMVWSIGKYSLAIKPNDAHIEVVCSLLVV